MSEDENKSELIVEEGKDEKKLSAYWIIVSVLLAANLLFWAISGFSQEGLFIMLGFALLGFIIGGTLSTAVALITVSTALLGPVLLFAFPGALLWLIGLGIVIAIGGYFVNG